MIQAQIEHVNTSLSFKNDQMTFDPHHRNRTSGMQLTEQFNNESVWKRPKDDFEER